MPPASLRCSSISPGKSKSSWAGYAASWDARSPARSERTAIMDSGGHMAPTAQGIHHITAIAGDPQRNLDFYAGILGLRFVKRTVNFDDPQTYHFYYGDEVGTPGPIMTFFPCPGARRGRQGTGQVAVTSFAVVPTALGFWIER